VHRGNEYFGLDRWEAVPVKVLLYPQFDEVTHYEDDEIIIYTSRDGIKRKAMKEGTVRGTRPSMDEYMDFPVKTREDFLEMKKRFNPHSPIRYPQWWDERVRIWAQRDYSLCLLENGTFGLYSMLRRWMGTEAACLVFYDDPALAEEMLDFLVDFFVETTHRALGEVQADHFSFFEDFAFKTGPLVSPAIFRRFLLPRYRRITDLLRAHGVDIIQLDSDGNPTVLIPLFLEAGINCTWPLEVAAGMDALTVRKEYGRDLLLQGGIDKREIARGRQEIDRELYRQVPQLLEQGGYIPFLDHAFPPDISYENFLYYLEVKRKIIEGR
ncbi:MAG: hypothetical protein HYY04_10450, partial [Chloroflexi bacterium]|nr:hypothetical protein [Chloroflexota bacterium]